MTQSIHGDWLDLGPIEHIPRRGARTLAVADGEEIAVFRTGDDRIYALVNRCPHKGGPLSQGIVHGSSVACPLHNWIIDLATGHPTGADAGKGCTPVVPVEVRDGRVLLGVPVAGD